MTMISFLPENDFIMMTSQHNGTLPLCPENCAYRPIPMSSSQLLLEEKNVSIILAEKIAFDHI
jgi:hypothetical protein